MVQRWVGVGPEARSRLLLLLLLTLAVAAAWSLRFVQDDAFISYRYAENYVHGLGLVWNPGERVEGYSNFLWTMMLAGGMALGIEPVLWSQLLGVICFAAAILLAWQICSRLFGTRSPGLLCLLLLCSNYTFLCFATGGLETELQTMLVLLMLWLSLALKDLSRFTSLVALAFCGAASVLTRFDSLLFCLVIGGYAIRRIFRESLAPWNALARLLVIHAVILAPWTVWRLLFYRELFPNTFYLKASSSFFQNAGHGIRYLILFFGSYWMAPVIAVAGWGMYRWRREIPAALYVAIGSCLLWILYLVAIGGDFMEFRMMVPVLPLLLFCVAAGLWHVPWKPVIVTACLLLWFAGSWRHAATFAYDVNDGIEPVDQLAGHLDREDENWRGIGRMLDSAFSPAHGVRIATTAAGAIPYYSKLPTVDMLGVNDDWVARHGVAASWIPGHQRIAPLSYLYRKRVNLIFSHPMVIPVDQVVEQPLHVPIDSYTGVRSIREVELQLGGRYKVIAWYLWPDTAVDRILREREWAVREIATR